MIFKRKSKEELVESPLAYWEEKSYMLAISEYDKEDLLDGIFERVSKIKGIKIKDKRPLTAKEYGSLTLLYDKEQYDVGFYPIDFSLPDFYITKSFYFSDDDIEKLKSAKNALTVFMKFGHDSKKSYHLQLKLLLAMVPSLIGVLDESAEKLIPKDWVKMTSNSNIVPSASALYTVQAVSGKDKEVWLHTHGLCRCGLTELEILESDKLNYNNHYNLISTFASYLIDNKNDFKVGEDSAYIGMLVNRQPVVVTCLPWTLGLKEYRKLKLGNINDRKQGHNTRTSVIFIYKSEEDEKNKVLSKVSEYNNLWGDNPIFFISDEETKRMKLLAMERFNFVKEQFKEKDNKILIKIGIPVDKNNNFEHIWFELIEFKGEKFKARLIQEPYDIKDMHEGNEKIYTVNDVTDWVIYTKKFAINPENVYILSSI